jgi:acetyl-CoA carboxylase carboxyl transferase subunit alpha
MVRHYLDFEKPLIELETEIEQLRRYSRERRIPSHDRLRNLEDKLLHLKEEIFSHLTAWQVTQLARHIDRPKASYYIESLFSNFMELHGDRTFGDDPAVIGGLCEFGGRSMVVVAHQKGRDAKEMVSRNFGMPHPEGYRKALRLMKMAELFRKPILTMIDTPGAYPGVGAEERGQAEAIARNLKMMMMLRTPIVSIVIGEGGSGGALAIGVGDRVLMLQHSVYSVISPEACAAILWKGDKGEKKNAVADSLKLTARDLLKLGVIDEVVPEPLGGAHRAPEKMVESLKEAIQRYLNELERIPLEQLLDLRYEKFRKMGAFVEG